VVRRYAETLLSLPGANRYALGLSMARSSLAAVASMLGDHARAQAEIDAEVEQARSDGSPFALAFSLYVRPAIRLRAGAAWDAATAAEAETLWTMLGSDSSVLIPRAYLADHLVAEGRVEEADIVAKALMGGLGSPLTEAARPYVLRAAGRARLAAGDLPAAEEVAHEALAAADRQGNDACLVESLDLLAAIAAATGARIDAARMLGASDRVRHEIGLVRGVYEQAAVDRVVEQVGTEYDAAHAEGRAMSREEALAFVQRGRGKRGRPSFGWSSLTPTENDVARLVAEGLRNRDIAAKLLMSEATVKTHLTHVYAKLGVTNRTELAAQASQR
jgi:DNA-binding CsgD family transcriptional regulator